MAKSALKSTSGGSGGSGGSSGVIVAVGEITGGVDTHLEFHVAAARDGLGRVLGTEKFPATSAGYAGLLGWLRSFGAVAVVGVEGTGAYGAGLTTHLTDQGVPVVEVNRPNRQRRRLRGKSDPADAIAAAAAVQAAEATATPKLRTGPVESVRVLHQTRATLVKARTAAINTLKALIVTAPTQLRETLHGLPTPALLTRCAALPIPALPAKGLRGPARIAAHNQLVAALLDSTTAVHLALAELARTIDFYDTHIAALDTYLTALVPHIAPHTTALHGLGVLTTAQLLITAGDNPDRLHSSAAFAALTGVAPQDRSSGKHHHHSLNRAGDRQANAALYRITLTRMATHQPTRDYITTRLGSTPKMTKKHLIRCAKRYLAREIYPHLTTDLTNLTLDKP